MVRKQIVVPEETDARIRRLAARRGVSQSALIVDAVHRLPEPDQDIERILAWAGVIDGLPPNLSEQVDEILYGS